MAVYEIKYNDSSFGDDDLFNRDIVEIKDGVITGYFYKEICDVSLSDITILKELTADEIANLNARCGTCEEYKLYTSMTMTEHYDLICPHCIQQHKDEDEINEKYALGAVSYAFRNLDELKEIETKLNIGEFPECNFTQGIVNIEHYYDDWALGDGNNYIISYIDLDIIKKHFTLS